MAAQPLGQAAGWETISGNILHLVCNIDEAQVHIERCPERGRILCSYREDKRMIPFEPARDRRAGVHLVGQFRQERLVDTGCMTGLEPEDRFVLMHRDTLLQNMVKRDYKYFFGDFPLVLHGLPGFQFLDRRTAFLEQDPVTAIGTPHVDVDLDFLLAPGALVGTCHGEYLIS
jgi:hypothetical protein